MGQSFAKYYDTIHRYETNRLRNIARFFGHLLSSDAFGWHVFSVIHLNEEETASSSRIFIKILFEDLAEEMGMPKLQARLKDNALRPYFEGIFPRDNPRNTRFSINYFTSIKMGPVTEEMREYLANIPKPALPAPPPADSSDSESSYSSYTGSSYSRSRSRSLSRTPPRKAQASKVTKRQRDLSSSRSRSFSRSRSLSPSRSPPPRRSRPRSWTPDRSPSPPPRRRLSSPPPRHRRSPSPPRRRRSPSPPPKRRR